MWIQRGQSLNHMANRLCNWRGVLKAAVPYGHVHQAKLSGEDRRAPVASSADMRAWGLPVVHSVIGPVPSCAAQPLGSRSDSRYCSIMLPSSMPQRKSEWLNVRFSLAKDAPICLLWEKPYTKLRAEFCSQGCSCLAVWLSPHWFTCQHPSGHSGV